MKRGKSILLWIISLLLALGLAVYQRLTGPTYPVSGQEIFKDQTVSFRFPRSGTIDQDLEIKLRVIDPGVTASIDYRRFTTQDPWQPVAMERKGANLIGLIPAGKQPAAKIEYRIRIQVGQESFLLNDGKPTVARFKGKVPSLFLIVHVIFMFLGIILTFRTGLEALRKQGNYYRLVHWTLAIIFIGGLILGPIVQAYAFGDFWTGFPFGTDLTDNKTLIAFLFWLIAFFRQKKGCFWVILAALISILIYLVPHSLFGSELDYRTGGMKNKYTSALSLESMPPRWHQ